MDRTTLLGIVIGITSLVLGFVLEGGHIGSLFQLTAALIVFGGTIGAVTVSFPWSQLKNIPRVLKEAFTEPKRDPHKLIEELVELATVARREGLLALESRAMEHPHPFLREGLMMAVDGVDPQALKQILELTIDTKEEEKLRYVRIFEAAGGFAPTMGIIGTVMGLVHVLSNINDPSNLGPAIAVAFIATLYGVSSANVLYLPIANKLKARLQEERLELEMMLEGILSLQAGEHPQLIQTKLAAFVQGHIPSKAETEEKTYAAQAQSSRSA